MTDKEYYRRWHKHLSPKCLAKELEREREEEQARFNALPWRERHRILKQRRLEEKARRESINRARVNAINFH
jgi:hypothetical protein